MTGVVAPGNARDVIERPRQIIDDFAFALVAPLRSHYHHGFHSGPFSILASIHTSAPYRPLLPNFFGFHKETAISYRKLATRSTQASGLRDISNHNSATS